MTATIHKLPIPNWPSSDDLGNIPLTVMVSEETADYYRRVAAQVTLRTGGSVSDRLVAAVALTELANRAAK